MRRFTNNPLERLMMQEPHLEPENAPPRPAAPKGHFCYGCGRYGLPCVWPCYRERRQMDTSKEPEL
ncbi:MAG: hypothetical protein LUD54_02385 [Oscillospiraceae bacterium]|nr:hypothetical protein [Oscillospiraceae bacterium]